MRTYETPKIIIYEFESEDTITTSGVPMGGTEIEVETSCNCNCGCGCHCGCK